MQAEAVHRHDLDLTATSDAPVEAGREIEVVAVNGNDESDPAVIDCKVVETSSIILYGISDPDPTHPSGLAFTTSGSASAMSLDDANKASLDFVCDDVDANVLPVGFQQSRNVAPQSRRGAAQALVLGLRRRVGQAPRRFASGLAQFDYGLLNCHARTIQDRPPQARGQRGARWWRCLGG